MSQQDRKDKLPERMRTLDMDEIINILRPEEVTQAVLLGRKRTPVSVRKIFMRKEQQERRHDMNDMYQR